MLEYKKQFKTLAPQWYEELKEPYIHGHDIKNPKLNIKHHECCIVGEIHGFSDCYTLKNNNNYCLYCHVLSGKLLFELTLKRDNPLIIRLIKHINKKHPKLMEGKKC